MTLVKNQLLTLIQDGEKINVKVSNVARKYTHLEEVEIGIAGYVRRWTWDETIIAQLIAENKLS